jgi:hypothetical protein
MNRKKIDNCCFRPIRQTTKKDGKSCITGAFFSDKQRNRALMRGRQFGVGGNGGKKGTKTDNKIKTEASI